jgi:hypothetical protein
MKRIAVIFCCLLWCDVATAVERAVYSTGQDQSAALQAVYDAASDGDVVKLVPQDGKNFVVNTTLKFQGKRINVVAENSTLVGTANPLLLFGGTLSGGTASGSRGYGDWHGGTIVGNAVLVNYCYSKFHPAAVNGTLTIDLDAVASYNSFTGNYGNGKGPAVVVNQRLPGAWCNRNTWRDCYFVPAPAGQGTITCTDKKNYIGAWYFDNIVSEGGGQLFDCGRVQCLFNAPQFWDGTMAVGACTADSVIIMRSAGGAFSGSLDPRVKLEGVQW